MRFFVLAVVYLWVLVPPAGSVSIEPPRLVFQVQPPPAERPVTISFHVTINKDGAPYNIRYISGPISLVAAARAALSHWLYEPATIAGVPVEFATTIEIRFPALVKKTRK